MFIIVTSFFKIQLNYHYYVYLALQIHNYTVKTIKKVNKIVVFSTAGNKQKEKRKNLGW